MDEWMLTFVILRSSIDTLHMLQRPSQFTSHSPLTTTKFSCWISGRVWNKERILSSRWKKNSEHNYIQSLCFKVINPLTLILLTWRMWWPPNNASKWHMGFNSAFKVLNDELNTIGHLLALLGAHPILHISRIRVNIFLVWDNIL
jgi:hypothetical protein